MIWAASLLLAGCQGSPLFNHTSAPSDRQSVESPSGTSDCPLKFEKVGVCAALTWISFQTEDDGGVMKLQFWSATEGSKDGPYITPAGSPHVYLWMPEHGHGSSPVQVQAATNEQGAPLAGEYRVSDLFFIMPGAWDIHVQLKDNGSVMDEVTLRYVAP